MSYLPIYENGMLEWLLWFIALLIFLAVFREVILNLERSGLIKIIYTPKE